jgi:hypothetical protein
VIVPGKKAPDIITAWTSEWFIREHVYQLFVESNLTGFWTQPASAIMKRTGEAVHVRRLLTSGWAGIAPPESGIRETLRCPVCGMLEYSQMTNPAMLINSEKWDGSDFFMIWPLPMFIFGTERVVSLVKSAGFTGARFMSEFPEPDPHVGGGFTPGRLSYYMPEDRAHLLGDASDIF